MYLTACSLLVAAAQCVLGGNRLVLRDLVAVLARIDYVISMVLDLLAAVCVVVGVAGRWRGAGLGTFQLVAVVVEIVQLGHLVNLDRGFWRMFDMDVDDTGIEHWRHKSTWVLTTFLRKKVQHFWWDTQLFVIIIKDLLNLCQEQSLFTFNHHTLITDGGMVFKNCAHYNPVCHKRIAQVLGL